MMYIETNVKTGYNVKEVSELVNITFVYMYH